MLDRIKMVKRKMDESLEQLCEVSWMFSRQPEKDFTRNRKLSFPKLVSFLLAMEGGTLTTELIERFGCSPDTASASAFVQQRSKLAPETFPSLFDLFVRKTQPLIAVRVADGIEFLGHGVGLGLVFPKLQLHRLQAVLRLQILLGDGVERLDVGHGAAQQ